MSKRARDTIANANERRISERDAALRDPHFSLLADYDRLTEIVRSLLGQHPAKSRRQPHAPLFRLSTMAPLAHAVRDALGAVVAGPEFEAALESATRQCLEAVEENLRPRWKASAQDAAMLAARDAILAGVDRFLVELAAARPVKANVVPKPLPRRTRRDDAYRDEYWLTRRAPPKATPPTKATVAKLTCPQPSAFSIADEAYWLLVLVQQMGWPLPVCFSELYPDTVLRRAFSVDQVRYLIRRDWSWTALHCARAGVLIDNLDPSEAAIVLARHEAQGEAPQQHELFGRWPEPTPEAQDAWEEQKRKYFDELVVKEELSPADMAFALALVVAQCGWPVPALVTRLFPADWVIRRLPARLVAAALRRSEGFNLLDAAMAGTQVWELSLSGMSAFTQRQSDRDRRAVEGPLDPSARIGWLRQFFGAQGRGPVALRDRLEILMRSAINGADRKPEDRITLQAFAQAKAIISPNRAQKGPLESSPVGSRKKEASAARNDEVAAKQNAPGETPRGPGEPADKGLESGLEPAAHAHPALEGDDQRETHDTAIADESSLLPPDNATEVENRADAEEETNILHGEIENRHLPARPPWRVKAQPSYTALEHEQIIKARLSLPRKESFKLPSGWEHYQPNEEQILDFLGYRRPTNLPFALKVFGHAELTLHRRLSQNSDIDTGVIRKWVTQIDEVQRQTISPNIDLSGVSFLSPIEKWIKSAYLDKRISNIVAIFIERRRFAAFGFTNEGFVENFSQIDYFYPDPYLNIDYNVYRFIIDSISALDGAILYIDGYDISAPIESKKVSRAHQRFKADGATSEETISKCLKYIVKAYRSLPPESIERINLKYPQKIDLDERISLEKNMAQFDDY